MELNKIPTAEEFFKSKGTLIINGDGTYNNDVPIELILEFAKLHVKAALEAAADNAELKAYPYNGCPECGRDDMYVDKKTIINAYPENLII